MLDMESILHTPLDGTCHGHLYADDCALEMRFHGSIGRADACGTLVADISGLGILVCMEAHNRQTLHTSPGAIRREGKSPYW
jgi:hypothetical protein